MLGLVNLRLLGVLNCLVRSFNDIAAGKARVPEPLNSGCIFDRFASGVDPNRKGNGAGWR